MNAERHRAPIEARAAYTSPPDLRAGFYFNHVEFNGNNIHSLNNPREDGISARFLAIGADGQRICLTTFPLEDLLYRHYTHGSVDVPFEIDLARKAFLTEPETLLRLEQAELATGTHYFPRLESQVYDPEGKRPAYLMEFIERGDIRTLPKHRLEEYKRRFRAAMEIAYSVGVHFADLKAEDLKILPNGEVMITDFNLSEYPPSFTEEQMRRYDNARFERIFEILA